MELTRIKAGLYESADKRFHVVRGGQDCAPQSCWAIMDSKCSPENVAATDTLAHAKVFVEKWAALPLDD